MIKMIDKYLGRGEFSITVPPLDGALMPNELLEETEEVLTVDAPDCLALMNGVPVVSSHSKVLEVDEGSKEVAGFDTEISCMAGFPDGGLAVGLVDGRIAIVNGPNNGKVIKPNEEARCPTALHIDSANNLFVTHGSSSNHYNDWKKDLMEKNSSGSLWRVEISTGEQKKVCGSLAFPYGIYYDGKTLIVAESWRSRLLKISLDGSKPPEEVLGHLPGYVSRMAPAQGGGIWLTVFAPRSQLIEFVLRENRYRKLMMHQIEPEFWVAPTLRSNKSFREPLQAGGVKHLGIMKPWSPARSYGMVILLDDCDFQPVLSLHSRADGKRHGITSCLEHGGRLLMAVKGDGMVASFPLDRIEKG
jgi:hypothetical protein